jgi:hypothetical protein
MAPFWHLLYFAQNKSNKINGLESPVLNMGNGQSKAPLFLEMCFLQEGEILIGRFFLYLNNIPSSPNSPQTFAHHGKSPILALSRWLLIPSRWLLIHLG